MHKQQGKRSRKVFKLCRKNCFTVREFSFSLRFVDLKEEEEERIL